jgi:Tol biopolymer transport system component
MPDRFDFDGKRIQDGGSMTALAHRLPPLPSVRLRTPGRRAFVFVVIGVLAACDDDGPAGPGTVDGEGTIHVTVTTSGAMPDPDGYVLSIEGFDDRSVADGTIELADVPAGARSVELTDVAVNCAVDGDNPREVMVSPDATVTTTFGVQCPFALLDAIVFQSTRTGNREIFAMRLDGGDPVNLSNDPHDDWLGMISPDGTRVLIDSERNGDREIFVVNADGSGLTNLTNIPFADDAIPYWSPDGTRILFETGRDGNLELYTMNADGSGQTNLTNMPDSHERFGSWSPEGVRVLFTSNRDGPNDIYSMWLDGSHLVNLTNHPADDFLGVFSPDGRRIAFTRRVGPDTEVYVMNADGSDQTNLTSDPVSADELPHWSPDGSRLVFSSTRGGSSEIWTMAPDGSDPVRLTDEPGAVDAVARWGPGSGMIPSEPPGPAPTAR